MNKWLLILFAACSLASCSSDDYEFEDVTTSNPVFKESYLVMHPGMEVEIEAKERVT